MQERGLSAYLAELIGTLLLVFFITSVVVLFVSTGSQAQFGSDFAVVGLVHAFLLFGLIVMFGVVSGGHFNPAVTLAAIVDQTDQAARRRRSTCSPSSPAPSLGALLTKGLLLDEGRATHYGAAEVSGLLSGTFPGCDRRGDRHLLPRPRHPRRRLLEEEPQGVGAAGDRHHPGLHRHGRRPADRRCLQPGPLVRPRPGRQRLRWDGVWPYLVGPIVGSLLAAAVFKFVLEAGGAAPTEPPERVKPKAAAKPAPKAEPKPEPPAERLAAEPPGQAGPAVAVALGGVRRVTFSRNYTLSLSRTCQCYCKYCAFATHQAHIHAPEKVERAARRGARAQRQGAARPHRRAARGQPARSPRGWPSGATRTSPPTSSGPANGRWSGACCRTRTSACSSKDDLARLREVTASQGLMLESISERLMETVHAGSPTKHPAQRLATIEAAGELKIPFTSGILVGIGETEDERVESLEALARAARALRPPPGGDPPELRSASAVLRGRGR